jgi:hypothetical protein
LETSGPSSGNDEDKEGLLKSYYEDNTLKSSEIMKRVKRRFIQII